MKPPPDPVTRLARKRAKPGLYAGSFKPGQKLPYGAKPESVTVMPDTNRDSKQFAVPNFSSPKGQYKTRTGSQFSRRKA